MRHRLQLAPDGLAGGGRQVSHRVVRTARQRRQRVAGPSDVHDRFRPARHAGGRHHQIDGAVEQLARAQARDAPQLALFVIACLDALNQRVAEFGFGAQRQQLQAGCGAPHLAQQRRVDALRLLVASWQQETRQALVHIGLLVAIETSGDAAPEDPPIDFALHLVRIRDATRVEAARLFDAEIVARVAEARPQAESGQVEPANLKCRTLLAARGGGDKCVGHRPDGGERPGISPQAHRLLQARRQLFRRNGRLGTGREDLLDQC